MKRSVFRCLIVCFVMLSIIGLISNTVSAQFLDVINDLGNYLVIVSPARDTTYLWPEATIPTYDLDRIANSALFFSNPGIFPVFDPFRFGLQLQSYLPPFYYGFYWPIMGTTSLAPNLGIYSLYGF